MAQQEGQIKEGELQLKAAEAQGKMDTEDRKLALEEMRLQAQREKDMIEARLKILGIKLDERPQVNI